MKSETEEMDAAQNQEIYIAETTCSVCYAEFLDAEDLDVHIKQMHSSPANPKYCQFCTETYTDLLDYANHIIKVHLEDLRCCRFCTKVFKDGQVLKRHENGHIIADTYSCSQCTAIFREIVLLELHERKYHDNNKDGCFLKCLSCLSSILNLRAVSLLQTVGKKSFHCSKCFFSSPNLQSYQQHLVKKKCKGYVCDRCSGSFKERKNLIQHLKRTKRCLNNEEYLGVTTTCPDCKSQVHHRLMQSHAKICKALKCIDCNKVFNTIDDLSVHQMKEHPLDMTLIRCMFCLKEFIGKAPLRRHIDRVHKPKFHLYKYKCMDCNTIYPHPQKLFGHFFSKHKNLQPFTCKICNKSFRVRKAFSLHIKLDHNSIGFVEFDDQYHVFFTADKSMKPFVPECVVPQELIDAEVVENKSKNFSIRNQELLDTDTDATNVETEDEKPLKRKLSPKKLQFKKAKKTINKETVLIYSSDEEPLLEIRMRALKKKRKGTKGKHWTWKKNMVFKSQFTCKVCNKNCYTYQNHQNHMNLHNKSQEIECVKCFQKFNSKNDLTQHMNMEHATSKLTETLKNLLQKKKHDNSPSNEQVLITPRKPEKFTISMKKVKVDKCVTPATITPVETDLSVKNFLENFTPEVNDAQKEAIKIASNVTIKPSVTAYKKPTIKLTKFKEEPIIRQVSLRMPERFKQHDHYVKTNISIKIVKKAENNDFILPDYTEHNYFADSFQDDDDGKNDIPEVAHEVLLEGTEELPTHLATKIVIPKMPKGYSNIHIATLHSEAPFFKIIKVDSEKLTEVKPKEKEVVAPTNEVIDLPDGTKLVTANPLAHLLGDKPLQNILEPLKNKYYKPVVKDYQGLLAQAMLKLEDPPPRKKRNKSKKLKKEEEQC